MTKQQVLENFHAVMRRREAFVKRLEALNADGDVEIPDELVNEWNAIMEFERARVRPFFHLLTSAGA